MNSYMTGVCVAWVTVVSLLSFQPPATAQEWHKHRVTFDDMASLKHVESLRLSPDGTKLAFKTTDGTADGEWRLISIAEPASPRGLGAIESPVWSPDGRQLAYVSQRSGKYQVWVLDLASLKFRQVTRVPAGLDPSIFGLSLGGNQFGLAWSADGTKLAFHSNVTIESPRDKGHARTESFRASKSNRTGAPLVLTTDTPTEWTLSGVFAHGFGPVRRVSGDWKDDTDGSLPKIKVSQLFVVDLHKNNRLQQLTHDASQYFAPDWSPDGRKIVCVSFEGREPLGFGGRGNLYLIDVAAGTKTALTTGLRDRWHPRLSPDGKWIAFWDSLWEGQRVGVHTVSLIPAAGGAGRDLFAKRPISADEFFWSSDSESIVVGTSYGAGVSQSIFRVSVATDMIAEVAGDKEATRLQVSAARSGAIVWEQQNGAIPPSIMLLRPGATAPGRLLELNPQVNNWDLGRQEIVRWKTERGAQREGILIYPLGFQPGRPYPLIVDLYPIMGNSFYASPIGANQGWASRGYAVFLPRPHAPFLWMTNLSAADRDAAKGPEGWDIALDDVLSGVDELIRRGIVDPDRMGLYGLSNGGGVVANLVSRTARFRCAVVAAGASMDYVSVTLFHSDFDAAGYLGKEKDLWADPHMYVELSAVFHADKVATPMLLEDGDEDGGEMLIPTIEMYNGLRRFGKDVTLLRYPKQSHVLTGAALKDFWERENAFFDKYLHPETSAN